MAPPSDSELPTDPRLPPERLIDLLAGYWRAQVVQVFARLGLADRLGAGCDSVSALASACGADEDGLARLLGAAASLDLVCEEPPGRYRLTPMGALLRDGRRGGLRDYALAITGPAHWQSWAQLETAVRQGAPVVDQALGRDLWSHYAAHPDEGGEFSRAMGNLSRLAALDLVHELSLDACRCIVDVGGAQGVLLAALLARAPQARGILYDRDEVIARAREGGETAALRERIDYRAGDFFESVPAGGDLYLLKQILHDYADPEAGRILANIRRAAAAGTRLAVVEMPLPEPGERSDAPLVDLNMLVLLGGRERRIDEYRRLLQAGGWQLQRYRPLRGGLGLIEAVALP